MSEYSINLSGRDLEMVLESLRVYRDLLKWNSRVYWNYTKVDDLIKTIVLQTENAT